jgi:hypothetical protein
MTKYKHDMGWTRRAKRTTEKPPKQRTSTLDAESYKAKYLTSGNASHSRFMHYVRLARRDARQ